jgi:hypothetical protein
MLHWITVLKDKNGITVNFYRTSNKIKNAKTILKQTINYYKQNKTTKWIFEDIEKTENIEIHFTDYETNEKTRKLTVNKTQINELLEA